jgi:hypothetical protein
MILLMSRPGYLLVFAFDIDPRKTPEEMRGSTSRL